ncbi:MAG: GHKL domain-containing protein [Pseudomonadales bacterium]|nr:GHKL domain-containing protein [Pseudomonadales bacterium]
MMTQTIARNEPKDSAKFQKQSILAHAFQGSSLLNNDELYNDLNRSIPISIDDLQAGQAAQIESQASLRLKKILQCLLCGVILLDSRGIVIDCNQAAIDLLGISLKGIGWRSIIADQFHPRLDDGHEISLKSGKRVSLSTRSLGEEPGQVIVLNDLTETRQLQQQLSRSERLSAMGRMISSLAHQIRTPLSAALLYADKLSSSSASDYTTARCSGKILSGLQNIERQIKDMLIFARGESELSEQLSVSELVFQLKEAACDIPHPAALQILWQVEECDALITCNTDALTGAVTNLIENAVQAGADQQTIKININLDENNSDLIISVHDEGQGINEELLRRLEEPFVTTKTQGTGLGLAIVKSVVQAHGGSFQLKSREEQGVTAIIGLPLAAADGNYD